MPISRWISVSDSADMMAPDLTLARQAATYLRIERHPISSVSEFQKAVFRPTTSALFFKFFHLLPLLLLCWSTHSQSTPDPLLKSIRK